MNVKENLAVLDKVLPVVVRVHGGNHPELSDIFSQYQEMKKKLEAGKDASENAAAIEKLTNGFKLPDDACQAYTKVYAALEAIIKK